MKAGCHKSHPEKTDAQPIASARPELSQRSNRSRREEFKKGGALGKAPFVMEVFTCTSTHKLSARLRAVKLPTPVTDVRKTALHHAPVFASRIHITIVQLFGPNRRFSSFWPRPPHPDHLTHRFGLGFHRLSRPDLYPRPVSWKEQGPANAAARPCQFPSGAGTRNVDSAHRNSRRRASS